MVSPFRDHPDIYNEPRHRRLSLDSDLNDIADKIRKFKKLLNDAPQNKVISPFYDLSYRPNPDLKPNPVPVASPASAPIIHVNNGLDNKDYETGQNYRNVPTESSTCGPITYNYFYGGPTPQQAPQQATAQCPGLGQTICATCHGVVLDQGQRVLQGMPEVKPAVANPLPQDMEQKRVESETKKTVTSVRNEKYSESETRVESSSKQMKQYFEHGVILEDDWKLDEVSALYRPWPNLNSSKFRIKEQTQPPSLPLPPLPNASHTVSLPSVIPPIATFTQPVTLRNNPGEEAPIICVMPSPRESVAAEYPSSETLNTSLDHDSNPESIPILRVSSPPTATKSIDPVARHIYVPEEDNLAEYHKPSSTPGPMKSIAAGVKSRKRKSQSKVPDVNKSEAKAEDNLEDMESLKNFDEDEFLAGLADEIDNKDGTSPDSSEIRELADRFAEFLDMGEPESLRQISETPSEDIEYENLQTTGFLGGRSREHPTYYSSDGSSGAQGAFSSSRKPLFNKRKRFRHFTASSTASRIPANECSVLKTFESGLQQRLNNALLMVSLSSTEVQKTTSSRTCCRCSHQNIGPQLGIGSYSPYSYNPTPFGGFTNYNPFAMPKPQVNDRRSIQQSGFPYVEIKDQKHLEEVMDHPLLQNPIYAQEALPYISAGYVPPFLVGPISDEQSVERPPQFKSFPLLTKSSLVLLLKNRKLKHLKKLQNKKLRIRY